MPYSNTGVISTHVICVVTCVRSGVDLQTDTKEIGLCGQNS